MDGCHQLRRFKNTHKLSYKEYEKFPSSLFIALDRKFFGGAGEADPNDREELPAIIDTSQGSSCENQFKATRGWESKSGNSKELKSLQPFDETGVMGMVCRHGCPLRYLNMYTGERARHAITLLRSLVELNPQITQIRCCYDVACIFSSTVQVPYDI